MRIFTVKRISDGRITWEGIEFSIGLIVACTTGVEDSSYPWRAWGSIKEFNEDVSIREGEFISWTEKLTS
jgi:hypothetical protein